MSFTWYTFQFLNELERRDKIQKIKQECSDKECLSSSINDIVIPFLDKHLLTKTV